MNAIACDGLSGNRKKWHRKKQWLRITVPVSQGSMSRVTNVQCISSHVGVSIDIILHSDIVRRWNKWHFKDILPILPFYSITLNISSIGCLWDTQSDCSYFQTWPSECVESIADPMFTRARFLWFYTRALAWHISKGKKVGWGLGSVVAPASFPLHQSTCV